MNLCLWFENQAGKEPNTYSLDEREERHHVYLSNCKRVFFSI